MFKKRTEKEVRQKFINEDNELLNDTIETLKELGYINDREYIERYVAETISLKNLSIYEIKYKLLSKGIKEELIEEYFERHYEELKEYEKKSAQNLILKKSKNMEKEEIKNYLLRKNFPYDVLKELENDTVF